MSQQLLDRTQIRTGLHQVRGAAVANQVRCHDLADAGTLAVLLEQSSNLVLPQCSCATHDKERGLKRAAPD